MIKAGELASIKASEEQVFVLQVKGDEVVVRRPTQGQNGVFHCTETFFLAELETSTERRARIAAEQLELRNLFQKDKGIDIVQ